MSKPKVKRNTSVRSDQVVDKIYNGGMTLEQFADRVGISLEDMASQYDIKSIEDLQAIMADRPKLEAEAMEAFNEQMVTINAVVDSAKEHLENENNRLTALSMFYAMSKDEMSQVEEFDVETMQDHLIFLAFALAEARLDLEKMAALSIDGNRRTGPMSADYGKNMRAGN